LTKRRVAAAEAVRRPFAVLFVLAMVMMWTVPATAADAISGVWNGTLEPAGSPAVPLVLHIATDPQSRRLAATIDEPGQSATGIPVAAISMNGSSVSMTIDTPPLANVSFMGTLVNGTISGWWSQAGKNFPVTFRSPLADAIVGPWNGVLVIAGGHPLYVTLHIAGAGLHLSATIDDPTDGLAGAPVNSIALDGASLTFTLDNAQVRNGSYLGTIEKASITGMWTSPGVSLPLNFTKAP